MRDLTVVEAYREGDGNKMPKLVHTLGEVLANRMFCAPDYQRGDGLIGSERRTPCRFAGIER